MRYLIYGSGAVGGLIGGRLALAGRPVVFLARGETALALAARGLEVAGGARPGHVLRPGLAHTLQQALVEWPEPGCVVLAVKAYDAAAAVEALAAADSAWPVLSLLNGIGSDQRLDRLGPGRMIAGALTTAVQRPAPGVIQVERERGLGLAPRAAIPPALIDDLRAAGVRVRLHRNAERMRWSKLLTNLAGNAVSAILGLPPGEALADARVFRLELEALREAVRVMRALGLAPEDLERVPVRLLTWGLRLPAPLSHPLLRRAVAGGRGAKRPSLYADIGRGRSEVEWLNGAVVRAGARLGLSTPANGLILRLMRGLVDGSLDPQELHGRPAALAALAARAGVPGIRGIIPAPPGRPGARR